MDATGGIDQPGDPQENHEGGGKEDHDELLRVLQKICVVEGAYPPEKKEQRCAADGQELTPPKPRSDEFVLFHGHYLNLFGADNQGARKDLPFP